MYYCIVIIWWTRGSGLECNIIIEDAIFLLKKVLESSFFDFSNSNANNNHRSGAFDLVAWKKINDSTRFYGFIRRSFLFENI